LKEIITTSNVVVKDFESDMAVGIRKLDNRTCETAESSVTAKQTAGSLMLTVQSKVKISDL
jgi:hypothetical protein